MFEKFLFFIPIIVFFGNAEAKALQKRSKFTNCRVHENYMDIGAEVTVKNVKWRCTENGFDAMGKSF